jgi:RNA polymerase sigma factor (sigma-70 family)
MATRDRWALRDQLDTLISLGVVGDRTDGQLLELFLTDRERSGERAFAALVERHGPMVMRVCRSVLADADDARDAFQATFLVLVCKAQGLWVRDSIGPWLHQVAWRTARCARAAVARRRRLERRAPKIAIFKPSRSPWEDAAPVLHEELERLPERYRVLLVLCDMEGRTLEEAARHIGRPVGTVKSRLSRARAQLRSRLERRGITSEADLSCSPLAASLVGPTVKTALSFSVSRAALAGAASLALVVLKRMAVMRFLKLGWAASLGLAIVTAVEFGPRVKSPDAAAAATVVRALGDDFVVGDPVPRLFTARGKLEAAHALQEATNPGSLPLTIITVQPDGSRVSKGQVLATLDTAPLRRRLEEQEPALLEARWKNEEARRELEIAELTLKEAILGHAAERASDLTEAKAAERALERLEKRRALLEGAQRDLDRLRVEGAKATTAEVMARLDLAERLEVLNEEVEKQSARKTISPELIAAKEAGSRRRDAELEREIEARRHVQRRLENDAKDLARRLESLFEQIGKCAIKCEADGVLEWARAPGSTDKLGIGDLVQPRQKLLRVADYEGPMRVVVELSRDVGEGRAKLRVREVEVLANGKPIAVAGKLTGIDWKPSPDIGAPPLRGLATILLDKGPKGFRPDMKAAVTFEVDEPPSLVRIPRKALWQHVQEDHAAVGVREPDGRIAFRSITVGRVDDTSVEVLQGLKAGEKVVLDVQELKDASENQRRERGGPPD